MSLYEFIVFVHVLSAVVWVGGAVMLQILGVRVQREARDNVVGVLMNDVGEFLPQYYGYKSNYYGYTTESTA